MASKQEVDVKQEQIASPCIGICALDENDICVGCQRTGLEISYWGRMTESEKRETLRKVAEREQSLYI